MKMLFHSFDMTISHTIHKSILSYNNQLFWFNSLRISMFCRIFRTFLYSCLHFLTFFSVNLNNLNCVSHSVTQSLSHSRIQEFLHSSQSIYWIKMLWKISRMILTAFSMCRASADAWSFCAIEPLWRMLYFYTFDSVQQWFFIRIYWNYRYMQICNWKL